MNSSLACLELQQLYIQKLDDRSNIWQMSFNTNTCHTLKGIVTHDDFRKDASQES